MNIDFQYVDTTNLSIGEEDQPMPFTKNGLPPDLSSCTISSYPFCAIDQAFLIEAATERFYESQKPPEITNDDLVLHQVLQAPPLLHVYNAIYARTLAGGSNILWPKTFQYTDKEGESLPQYDECYEKISAETSGDSLVTYNGPDVKDLVGLYLDLKKFKRRLVRFSIDTEYVEYQHENARRPIAPASGVFSWARIRSTQEIDRCYFRTISQPGLVLRPNRVKDEKQLENVKMLVDYTLTRSALDEQLNFVLNESYYFSRWEETAVQYVPQYGGLLCQIPAAYYSVSKCAGLLGRVWEGWDGPTVDYEYEDPYGKKKWAYSTQAVVNFYPRILAGDLVLRTEY